MPIIDEVLGFVYLAIYLCFPISLVVLTIFGSLVARLLVRTRLGRMLRTPSSRVLATVLLGLLGWFATYGFVARIFAVTAGIADTFSPSYGERNELWLRYLIPAPIRPVCVLNMPGICEGADRFRTPEFGDQWMLVGGSVFGALGALIYAINAGVQPRAPTVEELARL